MKLQQIQDFLSKAVKWVKDQLSRILNAKKPVTPPVVAATPVEPTKPADAVPTAPVEPAAGVGNPTAGFLGVGSLPPVQQDQVSTGAPTEFTYNDGFVLSGSGHPVRNGPLNPGTYDFTFEVPEGVGSYQVDVTEIPGTVPSKAKVWVYSGENLEIPTQEINLRMGIVSAVNVKPGKRTVSVLIQDRNTFAVVVYFS